MCACVLYSMGSRGFLGQMSRHKSHMGEMRDSDWSRPNLLRSDWLGLIGAIMTTVVNLFNLNVSIHILRTVHHTYLVLLMLFFCSNNAGVLLYIKRK